MNPTQPIKQWIAVAAIDDFPLNGGRAILYGTQQIAIFNYQYKQWYAIANQCPHRQQNVLSRGLSGNECDVRKVACPLHKNTFDLRTGDHLGGNADWKLPTYEVEAANGLVYLLLEPNAPAAAEMAMDVA